MAAPQRSVLRAALLAWAEGRLRAPLPERWEHFAESAHWFAFEWVPLAAVPELAASQGDLLHALASPPPGDGGSGH